MTTKCKVSLGDCYEVLGEDSQSKVDLIYLDPPFFTQRSHSLTIKNGRKSLSFDDKWEGMSDYADFMEKRIEKCRVALKSTGSLFLHCDRNASHILRTLCDQIFGADQFRAEIIWHYKRWSNSANGLMPAHQTILYYTKTNDFTFHKEFTAYSETTNIDQILQNRTRDARNKSIYAKDHNGKVINGSDKKGVPLSDVWEIPFLNPKAKERVNYPTQKPILLLERIIRIASNEGDLVLDPFCGSGTTLVAAKLANRNYWGIDLSEDAVMLSKERVKDCIKTDSNLLKKGKASYVTMDQRLDSTLGEINFSAVQRNKGIDAVLQQKSEDAFVFVRLQKNGEQIETGLSLLSKAMSKKGHCKGVFIVFEKTKNLFENPHNFKNITVIDAVAVTLNDLLVSTDL